MPKIECRTIGDLREFIAGLPHELEIFTTGEGYGLTHPDLRVEEVGEDHWAHVSGSRIGQNEGMREGSYVNIRRALVISS